MFARQSLCSHGQLVRDWARGQLCLAVIRHFPLSLAFPQDLLHHHVLSQHIHMQQYSTLPCACVCTCARAHAQTHKHTPSVLSSLLFIVICPFPPLLFRIFCPWLQLCVPAASPQSALSGGRFKKSHCSSLGQAQSSKVKSRIRAKSEKLIRGICKEGWEREERRS